MTVNSTHNTELFEGGLDAVQEASRHLDTAGIAYSVSVAGGGAPGS